MLQTGCFVFRLCLPFYFVWGSVECLIIIDSHIIVIFTLGLLVACLDDTLCSDFFHLCIFSFIVSLIVTWFSEGMLIFLFFLSFPYMNCIVILYNQQAWYFPIPLMSARMMSLLYGFYFNFLSLLADLMSSSSCRMFLSPYTVQCKNFHSETESARMHQKYRM